MEGIGGPLQEGLGQVLAGIQDLLVGSFLGLTSGHHQVAQLGQGSQLLHLQLRPLHDIMSKREHQV